MKKLVRILKWLLGIALLIPVVVVILFYIFKKDIEQYGIQAVNNELTVPFTVKSYDATLWKTFPHFAFTLYDISIEESYPIYKKPLAQADELRLVFNIWKVIRGEFEINKVKAEGLTARIGLDKKGNYDILKSSKNQDTITQAFSLEDIEIDNGIIHFWDKTSRLKINVQANKLQSSLSLSQKIQKYKVVLKGNCINYISKKDTFVKNKKVLLDCDFNLNHDLTFNDIQLILEESKIKGKGVIQSVSAKPVLHLEFNTEKLTFAQLLPWIPSLAFDKNAYKSTGVVNATGKIDGPVEKLQGLINFSIKDATLTQSTFDASLEQINTTGFIRFGDKEELSIPKLTAFLDQKTLSLSCNLTNFDNPFIDLTAKANLSLEKVGKLSGIEQILGGLAKVDLKYSGLIKKLSNSKSADQWTGEGSIELIDAFVHNKDQTQILSKTNGLFTIKSNKLIVSKLKGHLTQSPFEFNGEIFPIATYLFTDKKALNVMGTMSARHIDYDKLNYIMHDDKASTQKNEAFSFPEGVAVNMNVNIDSFTQGKFKGQNLRGKIILANHVLNLNQIGIQFNNGKLSGNLTVRQQLNGNFIPIGYFNCSNVPIKELFYAFDNFSQDEITGENLSGNLDATINIAGIWNNQLVCDFDHFFAQLDLSINQGRLKNYEPLKALAQFVNVNELMDIQFEQVKQSIEIKNNWMYFSPMQLKNNAVNLELLDAKHSLNNEMDYHLKIRVNDLLAKKYSLRQKRDENQYTSTSDGGMNLFIHMYGNADNLTFKYDRKNTVKVIQQSIQQEKKTVKELLRQEMGLKPKDSTVLKPKHIEVEWDE